MIIIMGIAQPIIIDLEWVAAAGGGWGVTKYLQLDWMDGWMEKASQPRCPLY
jgi:hypothetical protein